MHIEDLHKIYIGENQVIYTDTRKISEKNAGGIFFALSGPSFNGNAYAAKAIDQGCRLAVVDDPKYYEDNDQYLLVTDSLSTMTDLAVYHRNRLTIPIIGITGSNGKTTTKEMLNALLSRKYNVWATRGNFNNHIGVPLTLLGIREEHDIAIVEMGTNSPGEIEALAEIASPTAGVITSIGRAHLEKLIDVDGVATEKLALYRYLFNSGGKIFYNQESSYLSTFMEKHEITGIPYSLHEIPGYKIEVKELFPEIQLKVTSHTNQQAYTLRSTYFGEHNLLNIIASTTIALYYEVSMVEIIGAFRTLQSQGNRSEILRTDEGGVIILDAYNANPSSMESAIDAVRPYGEDTVLVLGDMYELGDAAEQGHQDVVDAVQKSKWKKVMLIGEHFSKSKTPQDWLVFKDRESAKKQFDATILKSDRVFIKGSRGMALEKLLDGRDRD